MDSYGNHGTKINFKYLHELVADFLNKRMDLLDDKKSKLFLVLFCAILATMFVLIYNPRKVMDSHIHFWLGNLLTIKIAGLIGAFVITVDQFVLRPLFQKNESTIGSFIKWLLIELGLLIVVFYGLYGDWSLPFLYELGVTAKLTVLLALPPYLLACLLIALYKLNKGVSDLEKKPTSERDQIVLMGENGKIMLSLRIQDIIYLKAEDNYAIVYFLENGTIQKKLLRTTLKKISTEIANPDLIRIHRSYMINLINLNSLSRSKGKLLVQMNHIPTVNLPVSTTYSENLELALK